jgi:thioredoxin-like negative regulator of GroEL
MSIHYTIIYIGAAWCKTCKEIKPATESLATQFSVPLKLKDYDNDLDENEQAEIKKVPTIRITDSTGKQVAEWNVNQVASLREWLTSNIHVGSTDDF